MTQEADTEDLGAIPGLLRRLDEQMAQIELTALTVLKGHLLIEERVNAILELYVFNANHLDTARLQFHQKIELCRGFAPGKNTLTIWELITAINRLRNAYAHSLDPSRHNIALDAFDQRYNTELQGISKDELATLNPTNQVARIRLACAMCLGFLSQYEEDSRGYRKIVDEILKD